jgi:hypothetical protein
VESEKRVAELVRWRAQFEADRRRRGVPAQGVLFSGEVAMEPQVPRAAVEITPAVIARRPTCPNGHDYDAVDKEGRRRCRRCMKTNRRNVVQKREELAFDADAPHGRCKRKHAYILDKQGKRLCRPCRNAQKRRWRDKKREQAADRALALISDTERVA